jgi:hypothetical protein
MNAIIPKILIDGVDTDYLEGSYTQPGQLGSASLEFSIPQIQGGTRKLWNKEVLLYLNEFDSTPIFRGWIKRTNPTFNNVSIYAEDAFGYMIKGGESEKAKVVLTDTDNIDGLTLGAAVPKLLKMAKLNDKCSTDIIGDTTPTINSVAEPIRGTMVVLDVIKGLLSKAIDNSQTLPRPNIARLIDDGSNTQFIIEPDSNVDSDQIVHIYTERDNIVELNIVNRKVPTVIIVNGKDGVSSTFTHDTALEAYDRNYLEVTNDNLESPPECKEFAIKLFEANLKNQYEYGLKVSDGFYLNENDIVRVQTDNPEYGGNYKVIGKTISFSPDSFEFGISLNKKPPTLSEYLASRDN